MFEETKVAVKKAFQLGKILFGMGSEKYKKLYEVTLKIKSPNYKELEEYEDITLEEAMIIELQKRYKHTAISAGFTEKQGLAMLEYASMLEELK